MIQGVQNPKPDSQVEMHAVYMFMLYQLRIFPILSKTAGKIGKGKRHVVQCRPVSSSVVLHMFDQRLISRDQGRQHCPHTHQGCHHSPLPRFLTLTQRIISQSVREHMSHTNSYESYGNIFITYSSHIQCCNMLYPCGLTCPVCACGTLSHVASHVNLEQHSRSRASTGRTHLATLVAIPKTIKIYLLYHGYV